jgi:hypothetical protein
MHMRKLCLIALASLFLLPAAAWAERVASGDGSLVIADASARMTVSGHGLIFGHIDHGSVTVVGDYKPDNQSALSSVSGAKLKVVNGNVVYSGSDMRFFFPGGRYTLVIDGVGIDASVVGSGKFSAIGKGLSDDGTFAVDGGAPQPIDAVTGVVQYGSKGVGNGGGSSSNSGSGNNRGKSSS